MRPERRNPPNPSKTGWFIIGALVGIGIAAKLGVIYTYARMRRMR